MSEGTAFKGFKRPSGKPTPARAAALEITTTVRTQGGYVHDVADKVFRATKMSKEDRGFALLLAAGVSGTAGALDARINAVLKSADDVKPAVRDALRISAYELFFLQKSPHAAVDQGVNLVRSVAPRAAGLANFVLRRLAEQAADVLTMLDSGELADAEPDQLAVAFGFPEWLVRRLEADRGKEWTLRFLAWSNTSAPAFFMVNQLRVNGPKTLEMLQKEHINFAPVRLPGGIRPVFPAFRLQRRGDLSHPLFKGLLEKGALVVSDLSAQAVVSLALPRRKDARFLEIGSGRGSKTIMFQEAARARYGQQLHLEALESNGVKNAEFKRRMGNARVKVAKLRQQDATDLSSLEPGSFDAVFIDAPCSGVGTLRRHPEIRWRLSEDDITYLAGVGLRMLQQAAHVLAPGGMLVYATCTVLNEENKQVIEGFLASEAGSGFELVKLPHSPEGYFVTPLGEGDCDLHFAAVLRRIR